MIHKYNGQIFEGQKCIDLFKYCKVSNLQRIILLEGQQMSRENIFKLCCGEETLNMAEFQSEQGIRRPVPLLRVKGKARWSIGDLIPAVPNEFMEALTKKSTVVWAVLNRQIKTPKCSSLLTRLQSVFDLMKQESEISVQHPIYDSIQTFLQAQQQTQTQVKVIVDENMFEEAMQQLSKLKRVVSFYVVLDSDYRLAKKVFDYPKVKSVLSTYDEAIALILREQHKASLIVKKGQYGIGSRFQMMFPNFMRLSQFDKSSMRSYRINMYGLLSLSAEQKVASKARFIQFAKEMYGQDHSILEAILNYQQQSKSDAWILKQYTKPGYFYPTINNTLRMADQVEHFFAVGEPFNRIFHAIKDAYRKKQLFAIETTSHKTKKVYRKARLSNEEFQYLKTNVGSYIQILGFISTSKNEEVAVNFGTDPNQTENRPKIIQFILNQAHSKSLDNRKSFAALDNGYIDLHQRNLSDQPHEQEILINAMNIFKIQTVKVVKKYNREYDYIVLQYGAMFDLLSKDQSELTPLESQALTDYLSLENLALEVNDLGEAYLKNNKWQEAQRYFESKLSKAQSLEQEVNAGLKIAEALQTGFHVDAAIKQYEKGLQKLMSQSDQKRDYKSSDSTAAKLSSGEPNLKKEKIEDSLITGHILIDDFDSAEEKATTIQQSLTKQLPYVENELKVVRLGQLSEKVSFSKRAQGDFHSEKASIVKAVSYYDEALKNVKKISLKRKKQLLMKQTELYEKYSEVQLKSPSSSEFSNEFNLAKKFSSATTQLRKIISEDSYEFSLLRRRQIQIQTQSLINKARRGDYNDFIISADQLKDIEKRTQTNLKRLLSEGSQVSEDSLKSYQLMANIYKMQSIPSKQTYEKAVENCQKASKTAILLYSQHDPRTIQSLNDLALLHSHYSNHDKGIQVLKETALMNVNQRGQIHTSIAKTYYNMGLLYYQKGQLQNAMNSYDRSLSILQKTLKPGNFQKSVFKYKVNLEKGMILIDRADPKADLYLRQYRQYTNRSIEKQEESLEIGKSFNILGIYHLKLNQVENAVKQFEFAQRQFQKYGGRTFIELGRVQCNIAICRALLKEDKQSTQNFLTRAENIFKHNIKELYQSHPYRAKSCWYYGQVHWIEDQYEKAISYYQKSIQITKRYNWYCSLNEFICRYKIAECKRQLIVTQNDDYQQSGLGEWEGYLLQLMEQMERDIEQIDTHRKNRVKISHNKKYYILNNIYELLDIRNPKLILQL